MTSLSRETQETKMTSFYETLTDADIQQMRVYLNDSEFSRLLSFYYPVGNIWKYLPEKKNGLTPIPRFI